jgi:hypothetical protein
MARRNVSILDSRFSYAKVGTFRRKRSKAKKEAKSYIIDIKIDEKIRTFQF